MAISFAGIPLLIDDEDGKIAEFANRYLALDDLRCFGIAPAIHNNSLPVPYPNFADRLTPKINTLYWPTGASRWATSYVLADTTQLAAVTAALDNGGPGRLILSDGNTTHSTSTLNGVFGNLSFTRGNNSEGDLFVPTNNPSSISAEMYLLPPRPLSGIDIPTPTGSNGLWILPLVDKRYFWQGINLFTESTTWDGVLSDIADALGLTIGSFSTSSHGLPDSEALSRRPSDSGPGFNAAVLLDAVAATLGRRVDTLPLGSDDIELQPYTDAQIIHDAFFGLLNINGTSLVRSAGNQFPPPMGDVAHPQGMVPETLKISFPKHNNGIFSDDDAWTVTGLATSFGFGATQVQAGLVHWLNTTAAADFTSWSDGDDAGDCDPEEPDNPASPVNSSTVSALASTIATSFYGWLTRRHDVVFAGIHPWLPTGFDDYVEWSFATDPGGLRRCHTRVHAMPYNFFGPHKTLHQFSGIVHYPDFIEGTLSTQLCNDRWADLNVNTSDGGGTVKVKGIYGEQVASGTGLGALKKWTGAQYEWRPAAADPCDATLETDGTCPDGTVPVTVITDVQCISNQIVTCDKTLCLPPCTLVTAEDCGEGATEGGAETACCSGAELPETLTLTLTFAGATDCDECGGGSSFTEDITITWNGSIWTGTGQIGTCSEDVVTVDHFYCVGGTTFALRFSLGNQTIDSPGLTATCDPFSAGTTLGGGTSITGTSCTALVLTEFEVAE